MNVLVTGGAGYIGSCVSQFLIDKGNKVIIIDNLSTGLKKIFQKNVNFINAIFKTQKRLIKFLIKIKLI